MLSMNSPSQRKYLLLYQHDINDKDSLDILSVPSIFFKSSAGNLPMNLLVSPDFCSNKSIALYSSWLAAINIFVLQLPLLNKAKLFKETADSG